MTRVASVVFWFALLGGPVGCATAGSAWVSQPEPGFFQDDEPALRASAHPLEPVAESTTPSFTTEPDEAPAPRPRLTRTITLGETFATYTDRPAEQRAAERGNVNVTVNNYVTPQSDDSDGYYGYGVPIVRDARRGGRGHPSQPMARPTRPGQSWPAPKSFGPAFPFKTAPASPWAPDR